MYKAHLSLSLPLSLTHIYMLTIEHLLTCGAHMQPQIAEWGVHALQMGLCLASSAFQPERVYMRMRMYI